MLEKLQAEFQDRACWVRFTEAMLFFAALGDIKLGKEQELLCSCVC